MSLWDEAGYRDSGRRSLMPEGFTRLYRGATGRLGERRFEVLGRVRYDFGRGFWDEWYLRTEDGEHRWLTEDDHELALEGPAAGPVPPMAELRVGSTVEVGGERFVIEEVGLARCLGIEGQIPASILPDEQYHYADGSSPDGKRTLGIEYDDDPPTLFVGRWLAHADLALDDEGDDW